MTDLVNTYFPGQTDTRPWGDWAVLDAGAGFCVKRIRVVPGGMLSLQRHAHRAEHWVVVAGTAEVTHNDTRLALHADQSVYVSRGDVHRVANRGSEMLVLIEVQTGAILDEGDIERLSEA